MGEFKVSFIFPSSGRLGKRTAIKTSAGALCTPWSGLLKMEQVSNGGGVRDRE